MILYPTAATSTMCLTLITLYNNTTARRLGTFWLLDNLSVEKCRDIRRQFMISRLARWDRISKTGSCSNKKEIIYLVNINEAKLYCHLTIYLVLKYTINIPHGEVYHQIWKCTT